MMSVITGDPRKVWPAALALALGLGAAFAAQQKPATQPNSASRQPRAAIYDKAADPKVDVAKASERAKKENKRILLMFGFESCGWCHKLHDLFASDPEIRKTLSNEYLVVMVNIASPNASSLLETCKAALTPEERKKPFGYPFLAVLDADAKLTKAQPTDVLETGDHHDPKRVLDFLTGSAAPHADAKVVLEEALSRASASDKRVFLIFGAPWCGWCHRLEDWLAQADVAAILDRDFVVTKIDIDRMNGGNEVLKHYRSANSGGIPWYTILDPKGKALATADGPDGNIGYPLKPKEIEQFLALVKGQSRHLEAAQFEQLHRSLADAAGRIEKQIRH
ncbi:MAG: thioredoxin family protein [Isosphaeraceae bacterium]